MTLEDIKSKIKIEGTSEEQEILFKVFDKYLDRFTTTVGATAALIPPLVLKVDDKNGKKELKLNTHVHNRRQKHTPWRNF